MTSTLLTEDKLCAMFQAWLHEKPEATRRDVVEALRIIKDLDIAEKYEKTWKEGQSQHSVNVLHAKLFSIDF